MLPDIPWFVYAILLAPVGLIVFAAIYKYLEVRAASDWPSVQGKVVIAKSEVRKVKVIDSGRAAGHRFEERNFANIAYEYSVAGQTYRNNRVSIGEDLGNFQVAETIARYPVGMLVTIYYNRARRNEAVLERDMPQGLWGCIGILVVIAVGLVFGSALSFKQLSDFVSTKLSNSEMSVPVVALAAFGMVAALFAMMFRRQASAAKKWPVVQGKIKTSGLEQFRGKPDEGRSRGAIMFQAQVSYSYRYGNVDYTSIEATFGGQVTSSSRWLMERTARKYPEGKIVDVYVNPGNPSQAVLEPRASGVWILWAVAVALWGVAIYIATKG